MKILALDCSTRTGWATNAAGGIESGVMVLDLKRGESPGMRFFRFRCWLKELMKVTGAEIVVFEQAHHRGGAATELCVGLTTRVQEIAAELGREYKAVHSGTLKRFATGSGSAGKEAMVAAAVERFGRRDLTDDNEADALLLLAWAQAGMPEAARKPARKRKGGGS